MNQLSMQFKETVHFIYIFKESLKGSVHGKKGVKVESEKMVKNVINLFLLIDAANKSKISRYRYRIQSDINLHTFNFSQKLPLTF